MKEIEWLWLLLGLLLIPAFAREPEMAAPRYILTADGGEISFTEFLLPYDGSDRNDLYLITEEMPEGAVFELQISEDGAEALLAGNVQALYLRLGDADIPVLSSIAYTVKRMTEAGIAGLVISGTPDAEAPCGYALTFAPAELFIPAESGRLCNRGAPDAGAFPFPI